MGSLGAGLGSTQAPEGPPGVGRARGGPLEMAGAQQRGGPAPHCLPGQLEGEGAAARGRGAGHSLPPGRPRWALRLQPRRGLGLARAGAGVSQPHSFWLLRSPRRAGRRSPCSRDRDRQRSAALPGPPAAGLVGVTEEVRACWGKVGDSGEGSPTVGSPQACHTGVGESRGAELQRLRAEPPGAWATVGWAHRGVGRGCVQGGASLPGGG